MNRFETMLIAQAIKAALSFDGEQSKNVVRLVANNIADVLARGNDWFDRVEFLKACGL